jgi:hypothetical protein
MDHHTEEGQIRGEWAEDAVGDVSIEPSDGTRQGHGDCQFIDY